jgi:hypothetical protein
MTFTQNVLLALWATVTILSIPTFAEDEGKNEEEKRWKDLFNKKDLGGWFTPFDWGEFKIIDEEIHLKANRKFFLLTERQFADFIFEGEIFMPDEESNSGFMFRCAAEGNLCWGYQAEVDPSDRNWSGGLYDEGRRGWLNPNQKDPKSAEAFVAQGSPFKLGDWNRYRIHAEGTRLRIWINDVLTTDYSDPMDSQGYIGIQHHGEKGKVYRFRNLRIKELNKALGEVVDLFDGKTLNGFTAADGKEPGGGWVVEGDTIHLKEPGKGGALVAPGEWENFELTFQWKIAEGGRGALTYRAVKSGDTYVGPAFAMLDREKNKKEAGDKRRRSGAMLGVVDVHDKAEVKKAGQFNSAKIVAYRGRLSHAMNDKRAVHVTTHSAEWKGDLELSVYERQEGFGMKTGRIVMMDMDAPVWIKNLKIRVLR